MTSVNILNHDVPIERYFEEICKIPRESGNEKAISDYILNFAISHNLDAFQDKNNNVVIRKEATPGYEECLPIMLQAHMDMVCAKTRTSLHNFNNDPIELVLDGNILHAKDTSLGADDGYGIAFMLAILESDNISHPALECVFTVREEIDNFGAITVDKSVLKSSRMINLDGDVFGETFISTFSSDRITLSKSFEQTEVQGLIVTLELSNFDAGVYHGVNHSECGNSIKLMARLFERLIIDGIDFNIISWESGTAENFNPLSGKLTVAINHHNESFFKDSIQSEFDCIMQEFEGQKYSGKLEIHIEECKTIDALTHKDSTNLINMIFMLPSNMVQCSPTSSENQSVNNIGVIKLKNGEFLMLMSTRSKYRSTAKMLEVKCFRIASLYGFEANIQQRYASIPYFEKSPLRDITREVFSELKGINLQEGICPGGLEPGYFAQAKETFDFVQIAPSISGLHTVDEQMDMETFHGAYEVLCEVLKKIRD